MRDRTDEIDDMVDGASDGMVALAMIMVAVFAGLSGIGVGWLIWG